MTDALLTRMPGDIDLAGGSWTLALAAALAGLLIGSFLNVVIHRLPIMLQRAWDKDVADVARAAGLPAPHAGRYDLLLPASACPACATPLSWPDKLPLLSYIRRRGRCAACQAPIGRHYPAVELGCALLWGALVWHFGMGLQGVAALVLASFLLTLAVIDSRTCLLPDVLTLPLLWLGLLANLLHAGPAALQDAVAGAAGGYLLLWAIYWAYRLATGKEGMGRGDFKLLAALGAWFGWQMLVPLLLFASFTGAMVGVVLLLRGRSSQAPLPFGPFLALAGMLALLASQPLLGLIEQLFS